MPEILRQLFPFVWVVLALAVILFVGRRRRARSRAPRPSTDAIDDRQRRIVRAIGKLEISLMEYGRDVEGRLDMRIRTLGQLIQDADQRIEKLGKLGDSADVPGDPEKIAREHRQVYDLADQGLDKVEIARRTSTTPGEVELILGLRRTREGS